MAIWQIVNHKHRMNKMAAFLHVCVPGRVEFLFLDVCSSNLEGCNFICHLFSPHLDCIRINCNSSKLTLKFHFALNVDAVLMQFLLK